jgi:hypothetical protein
MHEASGANELRQRLRSALAIEDSDVRLASLIALAEAGPGYLETIQID